MKKTKRQSPSITFSAIIKTHSGEILTSLNGSPRDICSWSSFWSSLRAPMVCWFRTYSESSFKPASVKYFVKCSTLCLLAGKSSWNENLILLNGLQIIQEKLSLFSQIKNGKAVCHIFLKCCQQSEEWKVTNHQSVIHAHFPKTCSYCIDIFFIYPWFKELYSKSCWNPCRKTELI